MSLFEKRSDGPWQVTPDAFPDPEVDLPIPEDGRAETAVLAGGCFWCVEAVYQQLDGVLEVTSGYAGGTAETADYRSVCSGETGHAEVVRVLFDPARTSYGQLLKVFFSVAHDPTQIDCQGPDVGAQYRSAIFYADERQREVAESYIAQIEEAGVFSEPLATRLEPLKELFEAEAHHQDYAARNPSAPYIRFNAQPKLKKLQAHFGDRLKTS